MSFFHRLASKHNQRNTISKLQDDNNKELIEEGDLGNQDAKYFQDMYNQPKSEELLRVITLVVDDGMDQYLVKKVSMEEVKEYLLDPWEI